MKVKELIQLLCNYDLEKNVCFSTDLHEYSIDEVDHETGNDVVLTDNGSTYK